MFHGDGDVIRMYGKGPDLEPSFRNQPFGDDSALTKVLRERVTLAFDDQSNITDPGLAQSRDAARAFGIGSSVFAPLRSEGPPVGVAAFRLTVDPFTPDEIELLESFAAQAGNAVTNARLVADIEARNTELAEALELQTATSEILELISEHPGDLKTVLDGVLSRAIELIGANQGVVMLRHGDLVRVEAGIGDRETDGVGSEFAKDDTPWLVYDEPTFFEDRTVDTTFGHRVAEMFRTLGVRSSAHFPLKIDGQWIGQINLSRTEVRPFDSKQAAMLQTFADQAAIAIRNAGLFNDLEEALQLQTATSEVLALISEHPGDLTTVLEGILENAARLCGGEAGSITMTEGDTTRYVASHGPAMAPYIGTSIGADVRVPRELFTVGASGVPQLEDMQQVGPDWPYFHELARVARVRSYAAARLTLDGASVGGLHMYRHEVRPFDDAELKALASFVAPASPRHRGRQPVDGSRRRRAADRDDRGPGRRQHRPTSPPDRRHRRTPRPTLVQRRERRAVREGRSGSSAWEVMVPSRSRCSTVLTRPTATSRTLVVDRRRHSDVRGLSNGAASSHPGLDEVPPDRFPGTPMRAWGRRSTLSLPLLRNREVVGVLNISSVEPGGYTDGSSRSSRRSPIRPRSPSTTLVCFREIEQRNRRTLRITRAPDGHERGPAADSRKPG